MKNEQVRLADVAEIVRGVTFGADQASAGQIDGYVPILRAGNIQKVLILDQDLVWIPADAVSARQMIRKNDLVMCASSGSSNLVGKLARAVEDWHGSFGAFCVVIRPNPKRVLPSYLEHLLGAPDFRAWAMKSAGANIKNIRKSELEDYVVHLPTLERQAALAHTLDKADAIRKKRRESLELNEQFLRSVFLDMFGDPVPNPKGWQTAKLGTIAKKIGSGATPMGGDSVYKTSGISFIRSLNVHDHKFLVKDLAHLDAAQATRLANVEVMSGDVLLNITGASVARCCLVPEDILPARVNQHVCIIRPNEKLNSAFLESHLVCETVKRVLLGIGESMGATRQAITKAQLEAFPIIVPPIAEQERFAKVVAKVRQQKLAMEAFANQSEILFQSIQQQAFA